MTETIADGQDALRVLARAARALAEDGVLPVEGLLSTYRALSPAGHAGAGLDVVDCAYVARCRSLGGDALLAARRLRVHAAPPRTLSCVVACESGTIDVHLPACSAAGDALALALGLALEAAKLAHGLTAPAAELRAAFATPNEARAALEALASGGAAREVEMGATATIIDDERADALLLDRPVYVFAGAAAGRVHDLLSPYCRRLRAELSRLGQQHAGAARDDDVYAGLATLCAAEPGTIAERLAAEVADGFVALGPSAVVVRCDAMPDAECDRRVREAAIHLKRARAAIVCVDDPAALAAFLGRHGDACRLVAVVTEASDEAEPDAVRDVATGHVALVDNALRTDEAAPATVRSLPSRAFVVAGDDEGTVDTALFSFVQAAHGARASGAWPRPARLAVKTVKHGDVTSLSDACMDMLVRLGPPMPVKKRR